jgi:hypothetical protein
MNRNGLQPYLQLGQEYGDTNGTDPEEQQTPAKTLPILPLPIRHRGVDTIQVRHNSCWQQRNFVIRAI